MKRPPDDIETQMNQLLYDAYAPTIVVIPTREGFAVVGPFRDAPTSWGWIDSMTPFLPVGSAMVTPLAPDDAIDALLKEDLL